MNTISPLRTRSWDKLQQAPIADSGFPWHWSRVQHSWVYQLVSSLSHLNFRASCDGGLRMRSILFSLCRCWADQRLRWKRFIRVLHLGWKKKERRWDESLNHFSDSCNVMVPFGRHGLQFILPIFSLCTHRVSNQYSDTRNIWTPVQGHKLAGCLYSLDWTTGLTFLPLNIILWPVISLTCLQCCILP